MGHNSWIARVKRIEGNQRHATDREMAADAVALVEKWNADLERRKDAAYGFGARAELPQFSPTIGAALRAGKPFLRVWCRACDQVGHVDLRRVVRPREFPIVAIVDALRCQGACRGAGDPVLIGLVGPGIDEAGMPRPSEMTARLLNSWPPE